MFDFQKEYQIGFQINDTHKDTNRVFQDAILMPFIAFLKEMISKGADPYAQVQKLKQFRSEVQNENLKHYSQNGLNNALHLTLRNYKNNMEMIEFLLETGVSPDVINAQKVSSFFDLIKTS